MTAGYLSSLNHIVRESCQLSWREYQRIGKRAAMKLVAETDARAFAMAERIGIKRTTVRGRLYDLHYFCAFTEYPMYLCGPNVPKITDWESAFAADYRDNPIATYTITIDDQDYLDTLK